MKRISLVSLPLIVSVLACGDGASTQPTGSAAKASGAPAKSGAASAAPKASAAPSAAVTATAATSAAPAESAAAAVSGSAAPATTDAPAAGGDSPLPAELAALTGGLKDVTPLKDPKLDGFSFGAPKGAALESAPVPGAWSTITVDGAKMAFLAHAASDGGDGCPKMADMKKKVTGAKDVHNVTTKLKPWGKKSLGDDLEFWMFEKDGKFGFYGTKKFAGKDPTTYCAALGEQADAEQLKVVLDKPKAEALAGSFLNLTYEF